MIKSNISIASNIYVRSDPDIRKDNKYTEKITGAKLLNDIRKRYIGVEAIPFTVVQQRIMSGSQTCSYAKTGEMSFGPVVVDGVLRWQSRCEYASCPGFNGCVPREIPRETVTEDDAEDKKSLQEFFESLGSIVESDIKPSSDSAEEARVRYVALTRPKTQFITMKKNTRYFKRTMSGRVIETGLHNIYKTNNKYCKCITVGLTGDIDNNSFVSGDFDSILDLQEYIIHSVKLYDKLSAKRSATSKMHEIYAK